MTEIEINYPYSTVFDSTINILRDNDFEIKDSNKDDRFIIATKDVSLLSYGETIEISFRTTNNTTLVSIHSFSKGLQIIDWGTNDKNEKLIYNELKKVRA
jgi:hypothetical protein